VIRFFDEVYSCDACVTFSRLFDSFASWTFNMTFIKRRLTLIDRWFLWFNILYALYFCSHFSFNTCLRFRFHSWRYLRIHNYIRLWLFFTFRMRSILNCNSVRTTVSVQSFVNIFNHLFLLIFLIAIKAILFSWITWIQNACIPCDRKMFDILFCSNHNIIWGNIHGFAKIVVRFNYFGIR